MSEEKKKKLKSKATAVAASASLLVSSVLSAPANMPEEMYTDKIVSPPAIAYVLPDLPDDDGDDDYVAPEEEKKKKYSLSSWYASRKFASRLLISIVFAAICWVLMGLAYFYFTPAMPVLVKIVFKAVMFAILGLVTYAAIAKAFLPQASLKQILNWKVIAAVIIVACALSYGIEFIISSLLVHI